MKNSSRSPLSFLLVLLLVGLAAGAARAADWPQWRGPGRDARSAETGLLGEWPEGGPPVAWRAEGFGGGYSSLAVAGDRLFTMGDIGDDQFLIAASTKNGKILWKQKVGPAWKDENYGGPRATPTVDGDRVYTLGTEGDLLCAALSDGKVLWRRNLPADFGGALMVAGGKYDWRFSESPLVDGRRLVVSPGTPEAGLVALDRKTGEELWRAPVPSFGERGVDGAAYSSVVVSEAGGIRQYVQLLGRGLVGVEAESGRFLWGYNRIANDVANIPTPVVSGDLVFTSTGYGTGAALLRLAAVEAGESAPPGIAAEEVYFLEADTFQNHHGGVVLHDGHIYAGTGHNKGFPICLDLPTGKVVWGPVRNDGKNSAALIYADGRLYYRYQNGLMVLVEATPDGYEERGSFMIPDVEKESWSHPVISDGRLYLREQDRMNVYDVRAPSEKAAP